ncbi:MAG: hypothetical protein AAF730_17915 [Bacteroidota bacterium]
MHATVYALRLACDLRRRPRHLLALPQFKGTLPATYAPDRIHVLLDAMGRPHEAYPIRQVAGTNGKGSTASMLAAIAQRAGFTRLQHHFIHHEQHNVKRVKPGWVEFLGRIKLPRPEDVDLPHAESVFRTIPPV